MAKSNFPPEGDVRLTLNVRKEIHQKLKVASVMASTTMGQLVEQLITAKLDELLRQGIKAQK